ncbi:hypothetical protein [Pseudophaeobacter sp.]|uniref:hypothetical protein n=1 Tax=Pseudophaeobacter sp. TaxID=1971739 RepID=UPI00329697C1
MSLTCDIDLSALSAEGRLAIVDGLQAIGVQVELHPEGTVQIKAATAGELAEATGFAEAMRKTHRLVARRVLRENSATTAQGCSDADLAACGDLHFFADGLTGITGLLLRLFRYFEATFAGFADSYAALDQHYPVMMPAKLLQEVGYTSNFPQHVTMCSHFPDQLPVLEQVAQLSKNPLSQDQAAELGAVLDDPQHVLTPAVCLPCYAQHAGLRLAPGEVRRLTMQNHVFRYEANRFQPLSRGWDFSVRDIVFFGTGTELTRLRADVMERVFGFCEALEMEVSLELANDPFFVDGSRDKVVYQRMGEVKYELLFHIPGRDAPLAASSFNLHRDFYTSVYDIAFEDETRAESACMGFGLERWLYAFVRQKGLDPAGWPEVVRRAVMTTKDPAE